VAEAWGGNALWRQAVDCLTKSPPPLLGHGIGMCQDGARLMAERGYDYEMILHHYTPGQRRTAVERFAGAGKIPA